MAEVIKFPGKPLVRSNNPLLPPIPAVMLESPIEAPEGNDLVEWFGVCVARVFANAALPTGARDDLATAKSFRDNLVWCVQQMEIEDRLARGGAAAAESDGELA